MADSGGPLRVSLIGHSFIRRLRDFMNHNPDSYNLRLDNGQYQVSCLTRGGLTITRLGSLREFTSFTLRPDLAFLQIGGNDLVCSTPNISKLVKDIVAYAQYLTYGCGVKHVIIGQILRRDPRHSTATFNTDVLTLNHELALACADHSNISFWKHRGFWASMDFLAADGVHIRSDLDGKYTRKYLQSVKSAILHVSQNI